MHRVLRISFGWFCLVIGFLTFWLPLPTGLVLMALGVGLLLSSSPTAVRIVKDMRFRWAWLDRWLSKLEPVLPTTMKDGLRRTKVRLRSAMQDDPPSETPTMPANDQRPSANGHRKEMRR